jgi:hypothetical protein
MVKYKPLMVKNMNASLQETHDYIIAILFHVDMEDHHLALSYFGSRPKKIYLFEGVPLL